MSRMEFIGLLILLGFELLGMNVANAKSWQVVPARTVTWKTGVLGTNLGLDVSSTLPGGQKLEYRPNAPGRFFLSGAVDGLGASLSSAVPISHEDDVRKGKSTGFDWQFRFHFEKWSFDFFAQEYRGFYIQNTSQFQQEDDSHPYLQNADLQSQHFGLGALLRLSPEDFSLQANMDHSAIQTMSGWSWILSGALQGGRVVAESGLVPAVASGQFGELEKLRQVDMVSLQVGGGLGGAWIPTGRWFTSGTMMVLFGQEQVTTRTTEVTSQKMVPTSMASVKLSLGYNGDSFLTGVTLQNDSANFQVPDAQLSLSASESTVFWGSRF